MSATPLFVNRHSSLQLKDRITLIYPPATLPTSPYSSLPYMHGGLESLGIEVKCIDLNAEAYDFWLSIEYDVEAFESCRIDRAKSFFKSSESELLDIEKYKAAKASFDNFFAKINNRIKGRSLTIGGYVNSNIILSSRNLEFLAKDTSDPLSAFYMHYFSSHQLKDEIIGISVTYDFQLIPSLLLVYFIKKKKPESKILLGGACAQYLILLFKSNPWIFDWVDMIIIGDGVTGICEYLNGRYPPLYLIREGDSVLEKHNKSISKGCHQPCIPDYRGLPIGKYLSPKLTGIVMASEGCYYGKCAFCVPSKGKSFGYRRLNVEDVISAVSNIRENLSTDLVFFGDDSIDVQHIIDILSRVEDKISWQGEFRAEPRLSDERLLQLKGYGCLQILLGLESSSERVRRLMNKGIKQEDILRILETCRNSGINVNIQTIIGFPGETPEEAYGTARFLYDYRNYITSCAMSPFSLYKGSEVYNNPDKYDIEVKTHDYVSEYTPLKGITIKEKLDYSKFFFKSLCNYYPANSFFIDGPMGNHAMIYYKHGIKI